jgi:hypothetical protein
MTSPAENRFASLATRELSELASELQKLTEYELLSTGGGRYEGQILGFVKGLRISARLIYFLRKCLSTARCEVSWGHVIDRAGQACSPECDVIVHEPGHFEKWNDNKSPVMEFVFVEPEFVRGIVSCKSRLIDVDVEYPARLHRFGIDKVVLFAECCSKSNYDNLRRKALEAGYQGLWCAYFLDGDEPVTINEQHHLEFREAMLVLFGK